MNKYWSIVWAMIDQSDVALEVVDARFPSICRSNRLEERVKEMDNCNLLVAINKADLVPKKHLDATIEWFKRDEDIHAIGVSATQRLGTSRIFKEILRASKRKKANVAVVGFPNTGKSSLINRLRGKKAASTAPVAGHTRGHQKINVSNSITMFDTPGILPVKLPMKHQYLLGVIRITKLKDPIDVVYQLIDQFEAISPNLIYDHYNLDRNYDDLLDNLAIKKNRVRKGGEPDIHEAAIIFLRDHVRGDIPILEDISNPLRYE